MKLWTIFPKHARHFLEGLGNIDLSLKHYLRIIFRQWALENLNHVSIEAFMAIVETSTVHGAAKKIGLSQTGVTQRIRSLENSLTITLFTRSRKGMLPTLEGKALYHYCLKAIELEGEVLSQIDPTKFKKDIRINITSPSSLMRSRIIPNTSKILSKYPGIVVNFNVADNHSGVEDLKKGISELSVLFRHEVVNEFDSKLLKPEEYILVAPHSWKKVPLKDIVRDRRIIDFNEKDDVTINYLKKFKLYNLIHKERHFVNNTDALSTLIISGQGFSGLAKNFAKPFLDRKEIVDINPGKTLKIDFALAWYPRPQMPTYLKDIISSIK